jgi:hypothetical protein
MAQLLGANATVGFVTRFGSDRPSEVLTAEMSAADELAQKQVTLRQREFRQ